MLNPPEEPINGPGALVETETNRLDADGVSHSAAPAQSYAVSVFDALHDLPAHYDALFSTAENTSVFFTRPWFNNYIQSVLASNERIRIYAVETTGSAAKACAVLIMHYRLSPAGPFSVRILSSLSNYYTSLFGVVVEPGRPDMQQVFNALAKAVANDKLRWDELDLRPLAADDPQFAQLISAFQNAGFLVQKYFCFGNWYLEVNGQTFRDYFGARPSRLINTEKRKRKALEAGGRFRTELFTSMEKIDIAIADYNQIYNSSWKEREPYPNFIAGLIRCAAEQGWLRLGIGYLDNEPAAAQIWIVAGGQAAIYKLAYDERFAKYSVGTVLSRMLMEHAIDVDKVQIADYLTGDDSYKREWMSHRRERWGIRAFNPRTPYGLYAAARHMGGRAVRSAMNALRNIRGTKD
jgi:hypothetical protein